MSYTAVFFITRGFCRHFLTSSQGVKRKLHHRQQTQEMILPVCTDFGATSAWGTIMKSRSGWKVKVNACWFVTLWDRISSQLGLKQLTCKYFIQEKEIWGSKRRVWTLYKGRGYMRVWSWTDRVQRVWRMLQTSRPCSLPHMYRSPHLKRSLGEQSKYGPRGFRICGQCRHTQPGDERKSQKRRDFMLN